MTEADEEPTPRAHRLAGVARVLGLLLLLVGIGVIGFVVYLLWGTGLQQERSQAALAEEFDGLLAEHQVIAAPPDETEASSVPATDAVPASEEANEDDLVPLDLVEFDDGAVVGKVRIPAIGVEQFMIEGVTGDDLRHGPGRYPTTAAPGTDGNTAIAGHRTTWGAPFNRIDELEPGDRIHVDMSYGTFTYEVQAQEDGDETSGHFIVEPTDTWVLDDAGDNRLTLTSCHPENSSRERIIVVATLVGEPIEVGDI